MIKPTIEVRNIYGEVTIPWKRKVKKRKLKYAAVFVPLLKFNDHSEFAVFDCECYDADHLRMNIEFYLAQGLHPLSIKSRNAYLTPLQIDKIKTKIINNFDEGSISKLKALLEIKPSFLSIQAMMMYEK